MIELSIILGTFVISSMLMYSPGAWGILYKLRNNEVIKNFGLLECFLCTSLWIAVALCVVFWRFDMLLIAWAIAYVLDALIQAYRAK